MRPDKKLAPLLGLSDAGGTLANGYMKVDQGSASGAGIDPQTLQFHGTADRYTLNGAQEVAALYSDAVTETSNPAVSLRDVGSSGGQAASFAYDLARSVVYTRQGNPAWAGQKRDGTPNGIRSVDLFYGAKAGDIQPDWVDPAPDRRSAGRRAAAPAREPDHRDEPRQRAAAAALVPAARREGRHRPHRRRPQRRRHAGLPRPAQGHRSAGLLRRRLGVPARDVVPVPGHAACRTFRRLPTRHDGFELALHLTHRLRGLHAAVDRERPDDPARRVRRRHGRASSRRCRTAPTASSGATGPRRRRPSAVTAFASTPTTTTTGRRTGSASRGS